MRVSSCRLPLPELLSASMGWVDWLTRSWSDGLFHVSVSQVLHWAVVSFCVQLLRDCCWDQLGPGRYLRALWLVLAFTCCTTRCRRTRRKWRLQPAARLFRYFRQRFLWASRSVLR